MHKWVESSLDWNCPHCGGWVWKKHYGKIPSSDAAVDFEGEIFDVINVHSVRGSVWYSCEEYQLYVMLNA